MTIGQSQDSYCHKDTYNGSLLNTAVVSKQSVVRPRTTRVSSANVPYSHSAKDSSVYQSHVVGLPKMVFRRAVQSEVRMTLRRRQDRGWVSTALEEFSVFSTFPRHTEHHYPGQCCHLITTFQFSELNWRNQASDHPRPHASWIRCTNQLDYVVPSKVPDRLNNRAGTEKERPSQPCLYASVSLHCFAFNIVLESLALISLSHVSFTADSVYFDPRWSSAGDSSAPSCRTRP